MSTPTTANLRETRKEQSAAKRAAKATPKATPKQAAKKAAAKATPVAARKLRWTVVGEPQASGKEQHATVDGHEYAITGKDKTWKAVASAHFICPSKRSDVDGER